MSVVDSRFPLPTYPVLDVGELRHRAADLPSLLDLPHTLLTRTGRSSILLALRLLGTGHGDRVLVPTYHCPTMIAPVEAAGALPLFFPINSQGLPNVEYLERLDTDRVKAMLVAHYFGIPRSLADVAIFCRSRGIALIEDCAHCFFGSCNGVAVGSTGDFSIGSLKKFFPLASGGLLGSATRDLSSNTLAASSIRDEIKAAWDVVDLSARAGKLGLLGPLARAVSGARQRSGRSRGVGSERDQTRMGELDIRLHSLHDPTLEPRQLSRFETALLGRLDFRENVQRRRANYQQMLRPLTGLADATPLVSDIGPASAPYMFPLLLKNPNHAYARMRQEGLPVFRWDLRWPGVKDDPEDAASVWSAGVVFLACHQSLDAMQVTRLCHAVGKAIRGP